MLELSIIAIAAAIILSNIITLLFAQYRIKALNGLIKIKDDNSEHCLTQYESLLEHSKHGQDLVEKFSAMLMEAREESSQHFYLALDMVKNHKKSMNLIHDLKKELVEILNTDTAPEKKEAYMYCLEKLSFLIGRIEQSLDADLDKIQAVQDEQVDSLSNDI